METTLRALASRPSLTSRTSELKRRAVAATAAAGRACSPASLAITTGADSTALPCARAIASGPAAARRTSSSASRPPRTRPVRPCNAATRSMLTTSTGVIRLRACLAT